jgi:hypothetical protein
MSLMFCNSQFCECVHDAYSHTMLMCAAMLVQKIVNVITLQLCESPGYNLPEVTW